METPAQRLEKMAFALYSLMSFTTLDPKDFRTLDNAAKGIEAVAKRLREGEKK